MKKDRMKNGAKKIAGMLLTAGVLACGITGCKDADSGNTSGSEKQTTEAGEHTSKNGIATLDNGAMREDLTALEVANLINQTFVDTIRATGGNNSNRFLLIAGFGTDIDSTCDNRYVMPTDSAQNKLLVSVHYYTPSGYCINESLSSWGNAEQYEEMNQLLRKMTMFTAQGYGVIIGEYAVFPENETTLKEGALAYTENFLNNCDQYGYCPMLWDTNNLFKKDGTGFWDQDLAAIYTNRSFAAQSDMSEEEIIAAAKEAKETDLSNASSDVGVSADEAKAWIMYNSSDWSVMYCSQDRYDPTQITEGIVATDAEITGEGTYTVALDFTQTAAGYANGVVFSAVGIANGESLYPGYCIEITEIKINGEPYTLTFAKV